MNNSKITIIMKEYNENYNEIKNNIIKNFLNPFYKDTCVKIKNTIIADMQKRSWFPITCEDDELIFNIGNDISITITIMYSKTQTGYWRISNFN